MTFNTNYHDTGLWGVYAVVDKDCAMDDIAWAIMEVLGPLVLQRVGAMICSSRAQHVRGESADPIAEPLWDLQEVTKLVYEVTEDDVTRAKNQLKAMQLFGIGNTGGTHGLPVGRTWRNSGPALQSGVSCDSCGHCTAPEHRMLCGRSR